MRVGLALWLPFSLLAALVAFVVSYQEYGRHFPDRRRVVLESARAAGVALVFFLLAGFAIVPLLSRLSR